ncbi:MAG: hypothetical protein ABII02_03285 [Candidatus Magasanikbacteria bacterium]
MKLIIRSLCLIAVLMACFLYVDAMAAAPPSVGQQLGAFTGGKGANLGTPVDPRVAVAKIIKTVLTYIGLLMIILVIYAGVVIMTSGGNEEKVTKGKKILLGAVVGLSIILSSYAITLVVSKILQAGKVKDGIQVCIQRPTNVQEDILGESINEANKPSFIPYCDSF